MLVNNTSKDPMKMEYFLKKIKFITKMILFPQWKHGKLL